MNIVDVIIIIIMIIMAIIGFKRGFIHSIVSFVGTILVLILSFTFKNYVSIVLYENLPFLKFSGFFKNVSVINILFYEMTAFMIVFIVLSILLKIFVKVSKLIEKIFKATIILSIPSKIAGAIVGFVEGYIISFVFLYVFSLSIFNIPEMKASKYRDQILATPVLTSISDDASVVIKDFEELKEEYENGEDAEKFNAKSLDLFLKYNIISVDSVDKLVERKKLKINNIEDILAKYRNKNEKSIESEENNNENNE